MKNRITLSGDKETLLIFHLFFYTVATAFLGALILLAPKCVVADESIWIVASKDLPVMTLSRNEAANLFLGLGSSATQMIPFDQNNAQVREHFYRQVSDLSLASVRAHWAKQIFTGRGRPPAMLTLDDVEQTLSRNPAAVTYIPAGRIPAGSNVLLKLKSGGQQ